MIENLLLRVEQYNSEADVSIIIKALDYATKAHENQYRKSGEKYITHPIEVAKILAELELDVETISAGLLHDVIEDTDATYDDIKREFGTDIADLTNGVTKLGKIAYRSKEETQAENMRKMFLAMGKDIRVILIKLADRLHNMRTLKHMRPEKAKEIAQETLDIYAPIANRLGISKIKVELEDIALRYIDPESYYDLVEKISLKKEERDEYINSVIDKIHEKIKESNISANITGRAKHFYSIYKKMKNQNKEFDEIFDLMAVRVLVDNLSNCYAILGVVHGMWRPLLARVKDYIANPKPNMYQSLHTTVIGPDGEPLEIQIRTWEMHKTAEVGIAAHWKYKEGRINTKDSELESQLTWLKSMMEWQQEVSDSSEFMQSLKTDLFTEIQVFTPQGKIIALPTGAIPLDFAYKVHSEVGNKMVGAKVNGRIVPQTYELQVGDIVEILTSANSNGPSRDWLNIVKSTHTKNKIRQWFKKERKEENIKHGRDVFERELKRNGLSQTEVLKQKYMAPILKSLNLQTEDDMYNAIGYGGVTIGQIVPKLKEKYEQDKKEEKPKKDDISILAEHIIEPQRKKEYVSDQGVKVKGHTSILVRFAKCCSPLPGDDIVGYVTKGRGISIHRRDCDNIDLTDEISNLKLVDVEWDDKNGKKNDFDVVISLSAYDRSGLFSDVSKAISDEKIKVNGLNAKSNKEFVASMTINITVNSKEQLKDIINKLKRIDGVSAVERV